MTCSSKVPSANTDIESVVAIAEIGEGCHKIVVVFAEHATQKFLRGSVVNKAKQTDQVFLLLTSASHSLKILTCCRLSNALSAKN